MNNTKGTGTSANAAPEQYDLVILGSGAGAKLSAWTFASRGQQVGVVEAKYVGGSCPNIACLTQQEHYSHRAGGVLCPQKRRVRHREGRVQGRHVRGARPQAEDGGRPG
jgi:choline dehydrogenase-like flavoprotein